MHKKIVFLTGNKHKAEIAKAVFNLYDIDVETHDIDLEEIQETDIAKIAIWSAKQGAERLNCPVIKTDVGFHIDALNGFPGAFAKYVFPQLGVEGMLKLMAGVKNRHGTSIEVLAFATPNGTIKTWSTTRNLEIRTAPEGTGSAFDQIMVVADEHSVAYGTLSHEEKMNWWRATPNYFHDFAKWYQLYDEK